MQSRLAKHQIVLLGIGHTNSHVVRMWRMNRIPNARLVCVSDTFTATYSGMLPGVLAGQYAPERMEIDLARLCASSGALLIVGEVVGLDTDSQQLLFKDRPPLAYDVLSIGVGSVPSNEGTTFDENAPVLSIKPMQTFLSRLSSRIDEVSKLRDSTTDRRLRVVVVGGGVGGIEICFCLPKYLEKKRLTYEIALIHGGATVPNGMSEKGARLTQDELSARGVELHLRERVARVSQQQVQLASGTSLDADIVLWAAGASAPPLLSKLNLPVDQRGFLRTDSTLRTTAGHSVFVVGDTGTIDGENLDKAGVYAVRQGPVLWNNIDNILHGLPLEPYRPQRRYLKLLNMADGTAIAEYGQRAKRGRWAWLLKDRIDRRFMAMYQEYAPPMLHDEPMDAPMDAADEQQMRCTGCGGKVGGTVLSNVLERLDIDTSIHSEHVLVGLNQPDDVAVIHTDGNQVAVTTDFFSAPLDDPFITGQMAALNSISDIYAAGATPTAALAIVTIPHGDRKAQEDLLFDLLEGGLRVLRDHGIALVGGHTIEGTQLTIGYTVLGFPNQEQIHTKAGLNVGDRLLLTKPLGSGVLLAAHMQARCRGAWLQALIAAGVKSNRTAAVCLQAHGLSALTDVTGFGLAGHLLEMLTSSDVAAEITLRNVPLYAGVAELVQGGIESTLAPANRDAEREIAVSESNRRTAEYAALFDPQTCGGLLAGVADEQAAEAIKALRNDGIEATAIGHVTTGTTSSRLITIV